MRSCEAWHDVSLAVKVLGGGIFQREAVSPAANWLFGAAAFVVSAGLGGACGRPAASPRHAPAASPRRRLSLTAGNRPLPASHSPRLPRLSAVTELDTGPRWGLSGGVGAVVAGSTSLPGPWNALHGGSKAVSLVIRGGPGGARSLSFTSFFASTARLSAPGA